MADAIGNFIVAFQLFVLGYFALINLAYVAVMLYAFRTVNSGTAASVDADQLGTRLAEANLRPVSVLIPAYNEHHTILHTTESVLAAEYPEFEVLVIDDGSSDDTLQRLVAHFEAEPVVTNVRRCLQHEEVLGTWRSARHPNLLLVSKRNGGKADALNTGIEYARFPLVCTIDADSLLESDALLRLGQQFSYDNKLVAVGGTVRVLNGCRVEGSRITEVRAPRGIVECVQAAEYTRSFLAGRVAWHTFRSLLIISGTFGLFRKDMLLAVGGYRKTVGEDMELVVRLHRHCIDNRIPYEVGFVPEPVCWTQVPRDLRSLLHQRNRWQRGLFDSLWSNRIMFLNPKYGVIGMLGFPYFVFIELLGPIVEFVGYAGFLFLALMGWVSGPIAALFFAVAVLFGMGLNAAAVLIDNLILHRYPRIGDALRIALSGSLEFLGLRQLITVERLIGTFQVTASHWGKIRRHAIRD
ncbi:MAG: hypothetical protein RLZZ393_2303 [Pseudomonadota bacterium]